MWCGSTSVPKKRVEMCIISWNGKWQPYIESVLHSQIIIYIWRKKRSPISIFYCLSQFRGHDLRFT